MLSNWGTAMGLLEKCAPSNKKEEEKEIQVVLITDGETR